jgi:hypothetical protein
MTAFLTQNGTRDMSQIVIYKYQLNREPFEQIVQMQRGADILSFGLDPQGDLCIWAVVDADAVKVTRRIFIGLTGAPAPRGGRFLGTCIDQKHFVLHGFDLGER